MTEDVKWLAVGGGGGGVVLIWPIDWAVAWCGESRQKDETQGVGEAQSDGWNHPQMQGGYLSDEWEWVMPNRGQREAFEDAVAVGYLEKNSTDDVPQCLHLNAPNVRYSFIRPPVGGDLVN